MPVLFQYFMEKGKNVRKSLSVNKIAQLQLYFQSA